MVKSLESTGKSGAYLSPTRSLVAYDSRSDSCEILWKGGTGLGHLILACLPWSILHPTIRECSAVR